MNNISCVNQNKVIYVSQPFIYHKKAEICFSRRQYIFIVLKNGNERKCFQQSTVIKSLYNGKALIKPKTNTSGIICLKLISNHLNCIANIHNTIFILKYCLQFNAK